MIKNYFHFYIKDSLELTITIVILSLLIIITTILFMKRNNDDVSEQEQERIQLLEVAKIMLFLVLLITPFIFWLIEDEKVNLEAKRYIEELNDETNTEVITEIIKIERIRYDNYLETMEAKVVFTEDSKTRLEYLPVVVTSEDYESPYITYKVMDEGFGGVLKDIQAVLPYTEFSEGTKHNYVLHISKEDYPD